MKIAVTGGKGGTGKSTVAIALAVELAKENKVLLFDADAGCPNDSIILSIDSDKIKDIETMIPDFDEDKCVKCGKCSQICRENAIVFVKDRLPFLVPEQCTGCKACQIVCPAGAISEKKQVIGKILSGKKENVTLVTGEMKPGIEEASLVVNAAKNYIKQLEKDYDHIIIDTAAGTHCPVIVALLDVDLGIAVTEPTPLGNYDLKLILELMEKLGVRSKIVLNRADIADKKQIQQTAAKFKTEIIAEIPYSKKIQDAYSRGELLEHEAIRKVAQSLQ